MKKLLASAAIGIVLAGGACYGPILTRPPA
jgi:hypothetical protein